MRQRLLEATRQGDKMREKQTGYQGRSRSRQRLRLHLREDLIATASQYSKVFGRPSFLKTRLAPRESGNCDATIGVRTTNSDRLIFVREVLDEAGG